MGELRYPLNEIALGSPHPEVVRDALGRVPTIVHVVVTDVLRVQTLIPQRGGTLMAEGH
jgi:hypothetical protein